MRGLTSIVIIIIIIFGLVPLGGCGAEPECELDIDALAVELLESGAFSDLLSPLDMDMAGKLYELDAGDISECVLYCSTGATAEEIALFKAADSEAARRVAEAVTARVEHQILSYEGYVPEEVPKLKAAVVRERGLFVLLCVSEDAEAAEGIISGYL